MFVFRRLLLCANGKQRSIMLNLERPSNAINVPSLGKTCASYSFNQAHDKELTKLQQELDIVREQKDIAIKRVQLR